ncbi:MAG: hypothetical protein D3923_07030, partial [Candidatus Electrothrix sp. AR3]|nr:hypothetical protein [Candidatus Electrothrix sp. AR3]
QAASEYQLVLALLTDENGGFSLPLESVSPDASEIFLSQKAVEQLQKFRLQAVVSPEKLFRI